jgi:hypothetical protein
MDIGVQIVFDAADPPALAKFWMAALEYVPEPPPQGFDSWDDFGHHIGMPEDQFGDQATAVDPAGTRPRLYFQKVPEGKTAKNRVHVDVQIGRGLQGEEYTARVAGHVRKLEALGATVAWQADDIRGSATVMRDPEGNEFCVC